MRPMVVALLSTDDREDRKAYDVPSPIIPVPQEALIQGMAELGEIEVHVISCMRSRTKSFERLSRNVWYHSLYVPKAGWLSSGYLGCIVAVRSKLRTLQPDIVHGQGTERECAISAAFCGRPNVVTIHGNMAAIAKHYRSGFVGFYYWCVARLETLALRRTGGVLCNSAYTEMQVAWRARKTWRVPNPLRLPFFVSPFSGLPPNRPPTILCVGVISPLKRQIELLKLSRALFAKGCRFELRFIGALDSNSAYGQEFLHYLCAAEEAGYARYCGRMTTGELISCFDSASALVHLSGEESFGLVIAESLARNLKLFATRVGGVPDITHCVEGAELFADGEWTEISLAIQAWLEAGAPRPTHAADAMKSRYHPRIVADQHLAVYRELLAESTSGQSVS